jgi:site-specific recombinase XerD
MKVTAYLREDQPDPKGLCKIYIRVNQGNKRKYFPTEIKLKPGQWEKNKVVKHVNEKDLNRRIKNLIDQHLSEDVPTPKSFSEFTGDFIRKCEENKWRTKDTIRHYRSHVNMFLEFAGDNISLSDIDERLLSRYNKHMIEIGNSHNTIWNKFKTLKKFFKEAGITVKQSEKYTYKQGIPIFLTVEEVTKIRKCIDKLDDENPLKKVAKWFYLQCMIGVRVGRLKTLDVTKILSDGEIIIPAQKGGHPVSMPLSKEVRELLKSVGPLQITEEVYNRQLKLIAAFAGIHKNLSSHVARHTFAMRLMELGKNIEVVQTLLGHRKISTTQIYGRIQNKRIKEELKEFRY